MKKRKRKGKTAVNRKHKDRLFRFVFQEKKHLLSLYNAINETNYQNPNDLMITTLEDAIFLGMKNDLSFIVGTTMNLYEHQSTKNANMPLRGLLYFAGLYQAYVEQNGHDLYGSKRIYLPAPNYIVFYNGGAEEPDESQMALSDCFQKSERGMIPCLECRVRILNINRGHNQKLMEKCHRLWEYVEFTGQVRVNLKKGMEMSEAVRFSIDYCKSKGILADILPRCELEVLNMLLTEYDEKKTMAYIRKEERERVNELHLLLLNTGRMDDLMRAMKDTDFQEELFELYGI